jgi:hypothetical protein
VSIGSFALQSSVYSTLSNDNTLSSTYGASVFDDVPEDTSYPYITLGEDNITEFGTKDLDGTTNTLTIHIWSEYKGSKETKQIMDRVHDLLHDSSLSVSGFNLINMRFEFSDIMRDPDGITRHGVMRFRAVLLG